MILTILGYLDVILLLLGLVALVVSGLSIQNRWPKIDTAFKLYLIGAVSSITGFAIMVIKHW